MAESPRYQVIYSDIKKLIRDGLYAAGSLIPTEMELCEKYGVSRTTVRKALSMLESEGFLHIRQGRGTEVLSVSTAQKLGNISSITETLRAKGYNVQIDSMSIQEMLCPKRMCDAFQLSDKDYIYVIDRLVLADEKPIAYIKNYINPKLAPGIDKYSGRFKSLYNFLETHYQIALTDADETITAIAADFVDSNLLQIPIGSPLLHSMRQAYSRGTLVDWSDSKLVAHRYEYKVHLKGRQI